MVSSSTEYTISGRWRGLATTSEEEDQEEEDPDPAGVSAECGGIASCVTLLRNVLHFSGETPSGGSSPSSNTEESSASSNGVAAKRATSRQNQVSSRCP